MRTMDRIAKAERRRNIHTRADIPNHNNLARVTSVELVSIIAVEMATPVTKWRVGAQVFQERAKEEAAHKVKISMSNSNRTMGWSE